MAHQRKTIRDAIVALLDTGTIVASGKVYSNRSLDVWRRNLPVINVTTQGETSEVFETCSTKLRRELTVVVEAVAASTEEGLDDALDDLADEIETAMKADPTWTGTVADSSLASTTLTVEREGDKAIGRVSLTYTALYLY